MSKCPKCGQDELVWEKTKTDKSWLKDQNGNWHTCHTPQKPIEISASIQTRPAPTFEERKLGKNYLHCELCPEGSGYLFRLSKEEIEIHNNTLHPQGQDYSNLQLNHLMEEPK